MIFALSEQTAATLSAAGFSATLAGSVALAVFGAGQYMTWRLEHAKYLRQKLEELIEAVSTAFSVAQCSPNFDKTKRISLLEHGQRVGDSKVKMQSLQIAYFPELSVQIDQISKLLTDVGVKYMIMQNSLENDEFQGLTSPSLELAAKSKKHNEAIAALASAVREFFSYVGQDQPHLTRVPRIFGHFMR